MKKLSILVALILCVTIGGVYATWSYPGTQVADYKSPVAHHMAGVIFGGAAGVYAEKDNTLSIVIDEDADNRFQAKLSFTGQVEIIFSPDANISQAALTAATTGATVTISAEDLDLAIYNDKEIFEVDTITKITLNNEWSKNDNGTYSYILTADQIAHLFSLSEDFKLDNYDQYTAFQSAQSRAIFRLVVHANPITAGNN